MTEGTTIRESLLELRKHIDNAGGMPEPERFGAVIAVLGRIAGLLEGQWAAIEILRANEEEGEDLDEVEGRSPAEQDAAD